MSSMPVYSIPREFAHGASRDRRRGPRVLTIDRGVDELIPARDRKTLSALSRRLVFNIGPVKEAIRQKATYSVGCAWSPVYTGSDSRGEAARDWLEEVWYPQCDHQGPGHDWHEFLEITSKAMDRDGEAFVLLVKDEFGFPRIQHVPSYAVWSDPKEEEVASGDFRGLPINDGVITRNGVTVGFRVNKDNEGESFTDISTNSLIHVYDRDFSEQRRGFPASAHALEILKASMNSRDLELIRQQMISSIFLIEKGELPNPNSPDYDPTVDTTKKEGHLNQSFAPGVRHQTVEEETQVIKHDNPGDVWESFNDRLMRETIVGMGWGASLVWKPTGQGTAERADIDRARKAVENREKKLRYLAVRASTFAVAVGSENPDIEVVAPADMLKWKFNMPARLTIDDGREAKAMLEAVLAGLISEQEYHEFRGGGYEQHCRQQAKAKITRHRVAAEESQSSGVTIDPEELGARLENRTETGEPGEQMELELEAA